MSKHICIVEAHVRMLDYLYYSCSWYCLYDVLSAYNPSQDNCHHTNTVRQLGGWAARGGTVAPKGAVYGPVELCIAQRING